MPSTLTSRPADVQHLPVTRDDLSQFRVLLRKEILEEIKGILVQQQEQKPSILRMEEVTRKTGYKKSSIYQKVAAGTFPAPKKLDGERGRAIGWHSDVIDEWIAGRADVSRNDTQSQSA